MTQPQPFCKRVSAASWSSELTSLLMAKEPQGQANKGIGDISLESRVLGFHVSVLMDQLVLGSL